ncbi:MAG: hypothetical protein R2741_09155 [Methanolobus sp.]
MLTSAHYRWFTDPNLSINEVGVPFAIAMQMTIPEKVTTRNLELLRMYILAMKQVPGANYAIRDDGRRIRVSEINKEELAEKIEVGWTVERQLMDGDIVLFNRQPSLQDEYHELMIGIIYKNIQA